MAKQGSPASVAAPTKVTRGRMLAAVERLEAAVQAWEASDDPSLRRYYKQPSGIEREVKAISIALERAFVDLFHECHTREVEQDAWPLVLAIDNLEAKLTEFADRQLLEANQDPSGSPELWCAYEEVLRAKKPYCPKRPEPIKQLVSENVPRAQIAKIYGFRRPDGSADVVKLQEEIENPGKHYQPETWVHPRDQQFWAEITAKWAARCDKLDQAVEGRSQRPAKRDALETVEELILQGVHAEQIAKMKRLSVDQVRTQAAEMGVSLDAQSVGYFTYWEAQRGMEAQRQERLRQAMGHAAIHVHDELGSDREARILAMRDDGHSPRTILDSLRMHFTDLQYADVALTLAKAERARSGVKKEKPEPATP